MSTPQLVFPQQNQPQHSGQQSITSGAQSFSFSAPVVGPVTPPSISYPIFPTLLAGQFYDLPGQPVRGPGWSFKKTQTWNNERQRVASGRQYTVKYWKNPLWKFEIKYDVILDDPSNNSPYFAPAIPATDFEQIQSFFYGMQGQGIEFAFQPPDSIRGGAYTILASWVKQANEPIIYLDPAVSVTRLKLGDTLNTSGMSGFGWTGSFPVVSVDSYTNSVGIFVSGAGVQAYRAETGTARGGQTLGNTDGNHNIQIVNSIGYYPVQATSPTPAFNSSAVEAVQLLDPTSITIYVGATNLNGTYTLAPANTIPGYQGIVAQFPSAYGALYASYQYWYICRFEADSQEYENFLTTLWQGVVKLDQVRI